MLWVCCGVYAKCLSHSRFRPICSNYNASFYFNDFSHMLTIDNIKWTFGVLIFHNGFRHCLNHYFSTSSCSIHSHILIKDLSFNDISLFRQYGLIKSQSCFIWCNYGPSIDSLNCPLRIRFNLQPFKSMIINAFSTSFRSSYFWLLIYQDYTCSS